MNVDTAASIGEDNLADSFESSQAPVARNYSKSLPMTCHNIADSLFMQPDSFAQIQAG